MDAMLSCHSPYSHGAVLLWSRLVLTYLPGLRVWHCDDSDGMFSDDDDDDDDVTFGVGAPPLATGAAAAAANDPVPAFVRPVGNTHKDIDAAFSFTMASSQHAHLTRKSRSRQRRGVLSLEKSVILPIFFAVLLLGTLC